MEKKTAARMLEGIGIEGILVQDTNLYHNFGESSFLVQKNANFGYLG